MPAEHALVLLIFVTCVLSVLLLLLYRKLRKAEAALRERDRETRPMPATAPGMEGPAIPTDQPTVHPPPPTVHTPSHLDQHPPETSPSQAGPSKTSPSEKARQELQRSVEHVRLAKRQTQPEATEYTPRAYDEVPPSNLPQSGAPESTMQRKQATAPQEPGGDYLVPCPSCAFDIPVAAIGDGKRYVCPQCGQPIRFEA